MKIGQKTEILTLHVTRKPRFFAGSVIQQAGCRRGGAAASRKTPRSGI
jgi:hypothetical protein